MKKVEAIRDQNHQFMYTKFTFKRMKTFCDKKENQIIMKFLGSLKAEGKLNSLENIKKRENKAENKKVIKSIKNF